MEIIKNYLHNVCLPFPVLVSVSTDVWPLIWLDRLIHFPGAAWKFHLDLRPAWSAVLLSAMVCDRGLYTKVVTPGAVMRGGLQGRLAQRGWWEGLSRLPADVVSGALCLFKTRKWNINLSRPLLHCIICEVTQEAILIQLPLEWGSTRGRVLLYTGHVYAEVHDSHALLHIHVRDTISLQKLIFILQDSLI